MVFLAADDARSRNRLPRVFYQIQAIKSSLHPTARKSAFKLLVFREEECETRYQLREVDLLSWPWSGVCEWRARVNMFLHKEEIRQGLKFIRTKENGHSKLSAGGQTMGRRWRSPADNAADPSRPDSSPFATVPLRHRFRVFTPDRWDGGGSK